MKCYLYFILVLVIFVFGCGGGGGNSTISSHENADIATKAITSAPWKSEAIVESDTAKKKSIASNIYAGLGQIFVAELLAQNEIPESRNISRTFSGNNTGTIEISGTLEVVTLGTDEFPRKTVFNIDVNFNGFVGDVFSIHGEASFSGTYTENSKIYIISNTSSNGGYSYKDSTGVYSIALNTEYEKSVYNGDVTSNKMTYVINGETIDDSN